MAKPKAPRWLTEAFRDGVDEREVGGLPEFKWPTYGHSLCVLRGFDSRRRPCSGRLERFHWISRQRVEHALGALLLGAEIEEYWNDWNGEEGGAGTDHFAMPQDWREEITLLAAWDPRNGGIACEGHHRRYDSHLMPPLIVPRSPLPDHVLEFVRDWGLEHVLEDRFPE